MSEELEQNMSEEIEQTNNEYSADSIQVLEGLEAVRMRPSMYIGDVNTKGLHHLVYEVVDNSIDEALAGYCKNIDVTINEDNSISVSDDGRGIPTGMNQKENRSALEVVMTILHAGGKFDKGSYKVSGGLHGVGVSCVNALSTKLVATIYREGKIWRQEYSKGFPLADVQVIGETDRTGTTIYFKPDDSIFYVTEYKYDILAARLRELAYLNRGIRLSLTDKRTIDSDTNEFKSEVFYSEKGLSEFVEYLDETREKLIDETIHITTEKNGIPIEVAMHYNTEFKENVYSYVNNINTIEGGTHLAGFRRGVMQTLKTYADNSGMLSKLKFDISGEDFREGLTAIISVKVAEPQFEGQTKTKLGNTEVGSAVAQAVSVALANYLEEHPKDARAIVDKVILAAQARHAARKARELVQRKTVLSGSGLPGKLADCSDNNPENCEIFLVEGDSAGGTAKQGRDRKFQAILPLRGKILNVEKALAHRVWESEEIKMIFQALGITIGTAEASSVGAGAACVDAGGSGADGSGVDDAASAFGLVRSTYPVGWSSLIVISASVLPLTFLGQGIGQHRHDAIGHHAGHVASMAGHVLDDGTGDVFKNRIGRQKQGFDASELAIDQRHAELGFIVAVLAQTLDDNGGADLLAVVGDQAVGGRNGDVLATGFVKGAEDHVDSGGF